VIHEKIIELIAKFSRLTKMHLRLTLSLEQQPFDTSQSDIVSSVTCAFALLDEWISCGTCSPLKVGPT
jgi:hypothetical protein